MVRHKDQFTRAEFLRLFGGTAAIGLCPWTGVARAQETARSQSSEPFIFTDRRSPVILNKPSESGDDCFTFAVFGDRTDGLDSGLLILQQAVEEVNVLRPDLVMNVGDQIQGYNQTPQWLDQHQHFHAVMNQLNMPWFPTPGNHDIYWRGDGRPDNEHESDYETHFGPLWYAFEHNGCGFIVLYSDEGNLATGEKNFGKADCQTVSSAQTNFLKAALKRYAKARHVFVFLHHPRWIGDHYGDDWNRIHDLLKQAGNVSACFAGHTHRMKYNGTQDNIQYYTLATTGGNVPTGHINPLLGTFQHYDIVTVRGDQFHVASIPVGALINARADHITQTLLPEEPWVVRNEQTRVLSYPIRIPTFDGTGARLTIGIQGAADNSGDKGIRYELRTSDRQIVKEGFMKANDYEFIEVPVQSEQELTFFIKDEDTDFEAKAPGNGGRIKMDLDVHYASPALVMA